MLVLVLGGSGWSVPQCNLYLSGSNHRIENLKKYFLIGGLPEAVNRWANERDSGSIDSILYSIIQAYEHDFAKHPELREYPKLMQIWHSLPSQLAKENKKFFYQLVRKGAREYEDALQWLVSSQVVTKVSRCTKPALPLSVFKLYPADVALLRRLVNLIILHSFIPHVCLQSLREPFF